MNKGKPLTKLDSYIKNKNKNITTTTKKQKPPNPILM